MQGKNRLPSMILVILAVIVSTMGAAVSAAYTTTTTTPPYYYTTTTTPIYYTYTYKQGVYYGTPSTIIFKIYSDKSVKLVMEWRGEPEEGTVKDTIYYGKDKIKEEMEWRFQGENVYGSMVITMKRKSGSTYKVSGWGDITIDEDWFNFSVNGEVRVGGNNVVIAAIIKYRTNNYYLEDITEGKVIDIIQDIYGDYFDINKLRVERQGDIYKVDFEISVDKSLYARRLYQLFDEFRDETLYSTFRRWYNDRLALPSYTFPYYPNIIADKLDYVEFYIGNEGGYAVVRLSAETRMTPSEYNDAGYKAHGYLPRATAEVNRILEIVPDSEMVLELRESGTRYFESARIKAEGAKDVDETLSAISEALIRYGVEPTTVVYLEPGDDNVKSIEPSKVMLGEVRNTDFQVTVEESGGGSSLALIGAIVAVVVAVVAVGAVMLARRS